MRVMILTTVFIIKAVNLTYNLFINVRIVFYFTVKNQLSMSRYGERPTSFNLHVTTNDPPSAWYDDIRPHFQPGKFDQ